MKMILRLKHMDYNKKLYPDQMKIQDLKNNKFLLILDNRDIMVCTYFNEQILSGERYPLTYSVKANLKMVTDDATSDGTGAVTINFSPSLRSSPSDNASITTTNPKEHRPRSI